jgi:hypothetical protein
LHLKLSKHSRSLTAANEFYSIFKWPNYGEAYIPKFGLRVFPFKKIFYADASFGWSFNLSGTETKTLGQTSYNASAGGFIYFLQVGARFNLKNFKGSS